MNLLAMAIERGTDAAQLERLADLCERFERNQAEGEFARALTLFQSKMPAVFRGKDVDGKFKYATFEAIMATAAPVLKECGIVVTFDTSPVGTDKLQVICKVRVGIHCEPTTVVVPYTAGNRAVTGPQIVGQTIGYGKRYSFVAALNIPTTDEDDGDPKGEVLAAIAAAKSEAELDVLGVEFKKVKDKFDSNEQAEIKQAAMAARERVKIAGAVERVQAAIVTHNNGERVPDGIKDDIKVLTDTGHAVVQSIQDFSGTVAAVMSPSDNGHAESVQGVTPAPDQQVVAPVSMSPPSVLTVDMTNPEKMTATVEDAVILEARLLKAISDADTPDALAAAKNECGAAKPRLDAAAVARLSAAIRDRKAALEKKPSGQRV